MEVSLSSEWHKDEKSGSDFFIVSFGLKRGNLCPNPDYHED